jgi:hypothetical protein
MYAGASQLRRLSYLVARAASNQPVRMARSVVALTCCTSHAFRRSSALDAGGRSRGVD